MIQKLETEFISYWIEYFFKDMNSSNNVYILLSSQLLKTVGLWHDIRTTTVATLLYNENNEDAVEKPNLSSKGILCILDLAAEETFFTACYSYTGITI